MAVPKTFTGNERLFAEDLNNNFEALDTAVATAAFNATDASNLTSGTVAAARLGDVPAANITGEVAEANLAIKFARGSSSGSDTSAGATVTFPAGRFSETPTVATASRSNENFRHNTVGGISSTGFTIWTYMQSGAYNSHPVEWIAVGV